MIRKTFACLLVAVLAGAAVQAQTAEELIEKNLKATGGRDKMEAVKSFRMTGKMKSPQGILPMVMEYKKPDKLRSEVTIQGATMIQVLNGQEGWMVAPFMGKMGPEKMPAEDVRQAQEQMARESFDMLLRYKERGEVIEYVGKEDVQGKPAYKLKMTPKSGEPGYLYLDAGSYLLVKTTGKTSLQGQVMETDSIRSDYKEVGGVLFAHSVDTGLKGMPERMLLTFSQIEVNPAIDEARFTMPAAEKPVPHKMEQKEAPPAPPGH